MGQEHVLDNLRLAARAARERGDPLGHVLLGGPGGLGKTTLARALAQEMGTQLSTAVGHMIDGPLQLFLAVGCAATRERALAGGLRRVHDP